ncbi:hypothetical protein TCCBUS3UF1_2440 [Thermus sp. CCB_US3_UF1]|nr:hypothetical protein TCCBUS3UF1_2440 [Thermus sp. CCB_US3_UF1]
MNRTYKGLKLAVLHLFPAWAPNALNRTYKGLKQGMDPGAVVAALKRFEPYL